MSTGKTKSRRLRSRRFRRAFKSGADLCSKITGNRINRHGYGSGMGRANCKPLEMMQH